MYFSSVTRLWLYHAANDYARFWPYKVLSGRRSDRIDRQQAFRQLACSGYVFRRRRHQQIRSWHWTRRPIGAARACFVGCGRLIRVVGDAQEPMSDRFVEAQHMPGKQTGRSICRRPATDDLRIWGTQHAIFLPSISLPPSSSTPGLSHLGRLRPPAPRPTLLASLSFLNARHYLFSLPRSCTIVSAL